MNLRSFIYNVSLCAAGVLMASCSDIAEDERFIYVEPVDVAKRVLIEDFTGQRCMNCPNVTDIIHQLQEEYGEDNIIAVGIHSGPFGRNTTLRTDDGDSYYEAWGVSMQPTVMVDRHGLQTDGSRIGTEVMNCISQEPEVLLEATCEYSEMTRNVDITVSADGLTSVNGQLQVWLTEDKIVDVQLFPGNVWDMEYEHNHVFRANVSSDLMGDAITIGQGERVTRTLSYTLADGWVPENMSAVVFVYNSSGVLQAAKAAVIPSENSEEGGAEAE